METDEQLQTLMNVGPRIADDLVALGVEGITDLASRDADDLYVRLCGLTGSTQDPCVLDTFRAAVDQARGLEPRPWWEYSRERKAGRLPGVPGTSGDGMPQPSGSR